MLGAAVGSWEKEKGIAVPISFYGCKRVGDVVSAGGFKMDSYSLSAKEPGLFLVL